SIPKRIDVELQRESLPRMHLPPRERGLRSERRIRRPCYNGRHHRQRREKAPDARRRGAARLRRGPATSQGGPPEPTTQMGSYRGAGVGLAFAQTMMMITPSP